MRGPRGWHSRGYLPHFDGGEVAQFVTFHLASAIPAALMRAWDSELSALPRAQRKTQVFRRANAYLDAGHGEALLRDVRVASVVRDAVCHLDGRRYALHAWVVMPTHVHVLFTPFAEQSVSAIIHSLKSYTASRANRILRRNGRFWNVDYFDRYIRDSRHFGATVAYIEDNPVGARLCESQEEWPFGSAYLVHRGGDVPDSEGRLPPRGVRQSDYQKERSAR